MMVVVWLSVIVDVMILMVVFVVVDALMVVLVAEMVRGQRISKHKFGTTYGMFLEHTEFQILIYDAPSDRFH